MQASAELVCCLKGELFRSTTEWLVRYGQTSKINYRLSCLQILNSLLERDDTGAFALHNARSRAHSGKALLDVCFTNR